MARITIMPIVKSDRSWVGRMTVKLWHSKIVVVHGTSFKPSALDGFIAFIGDQRAGFITFEINGTELEIVTLNSILEHQGVGTALMENVRLHAMEKGCEKITVTTTNDNLKALRFYQKRGFSLTAITPNAMDEARKIKPEIPLVGSHGIPLRDEIRLEMTLAFLDAPDDGTLRKFRRKIGKDDAARLEKYDYDGPVIYIVDTPETCKVAIDILKENEFVGFDMESRPSFRKGGENLPAVIQFACDQGVFIFQLLKLGDFPYLREFLESDVPRKVGIGILSDRVALSRSHGITIEGLFDLAAVCQKNGIQTLGAVTMMANFFEQHYFKSRRVQTSNWARSELTDTQIIYAASDAWICVKLYRFLQERTEMP